MCLFLKIFVFSPVIVSDLEKSFGFILDSGQECFISGALKKFSEMLEMLMLILEYATSGYITVLKFFFY